MACMIDSIPNQVTCRRKIHGLGFNLIVVGPSGIGKTTLINSLFELNYGDCPDYERNIDKVELGVKEFRPQNRAIDMRLTIIETKGFNNQLDRSEVYKPIVDYIEARYEDYLRDELEIQESKYHDIKDGRVHCCIYMISPTARGLKPIDLVTMKKLHQRVCLIPVIGRSDQLTLQERQSIKRSIMKEIMENEIKIYQTNGIDVPFAVAASDEIIEEAGKRHRVRRFPWGKMFIERDSDFPQLRDLLQRSHMLSLIDVTNDIHYERYRAEATQTRIQHLLKLELEKKRMEQKNSVY